MLISEIFYSVQGEGLLTGVPSVFVRTSGCNLRCVWCDTPYASWNPEGQEMSVEEVVAEVEKYPARHCVLTGGEPMIARGIRDLAGALAKKNYHITIETAGTVAPDGIPCHLASLSPKLSNSTPQEYPAWIRRHEATRFQPEILKAWIENREFQLKFVISSKNDFSEIEGLVASLGVPVPPSRILLMPQGITEEELLGRQSEVLAVCLERGYRYCDRLQIRLFGNTRGT
jgi:7-carboxy-7-deazaguanine synthase